MTDRLSHEDALSRFIAEGCQLGPKLSESLELLYSSYWAWCELNDQPRLKRKRFPQAISMHRIKESTTDCRIVTGVKLVPRGT